MENENLIRKRYVNGLRNASIVLSLILVMALVTSIFLPLESKLAQQLFILVNSVSGLLGQFMKEKNEQILINYLNYSWLFFAVLFGGLIGSHLGIKIFKPIIVRRLTAILIIFVGLRLIIGI